VSAGANTVTVSVLQRWDPFFFDILTVLTCEKVKILWDIEKNNAYQLFVPLIFSFFPASQK
jgi:hypothetical protein